MKILLSLAATLLSAPAFAHSTLTEHGHPHEASVLPGVELFAAALTLAVIGAAYFGMKSKAVVKTKARK